MTYFLRSLAEGRLVGLLTGLGAATADAVYGGIAAFGLTAVSSALIAYRTWLGMLGGASRAPASAEQRCSSPECSGSAAWWLLLSSGTAMLRSKLTDASMGLVNHVSGSIILAFGIYAIVMAFRI